MIDIMGAGFYPHDPLPGPLERAPASRPEMWYDLHGNPFVIDRNNPRPVYRPTNPILEPPMYFPGAGWQADAVYAG